MNIPPENQVDPRPEAENSVFHWAGSILPTHRYAKKAVTMMPNRSKVITSDKISSKENEAGWEKEK